MTDLTASSTPSDRVVRARLEELGLAWIDAEPGVLVVPFGEQDRVPSFSVIVWSTEQGDGDLVVELLPGIAVDDATRTVLLARLNDWNVRSRATVAVLQSDELGADAVVIVRSVVLDADDVPAEQIRRALDRAFRDFEAFLGWSGQLTDLGAVAPSAEAGK